MHGVKNKTANKKRHCRSSVVPYTMLTKLYSWCFSRSSLPCCPLSSWKGAFIFSCIFAWIPSGIQSREEGRQPPRPPPRAWTATCNLQSRSIENCWPCVILHRPIENYYTSAAGATQKYNSFQPLRVKLLKSTSLQPSSTPSRVSSFPFLWWTQHFYVIIGQCWLKLRHQGQAARRRGAREIYFIE